MASYTTGKELRKSPKRLIAVGLVAVLALVSAFGVKSVMDGLTDIERETSSDTESELSIPTLSNSSTVEDKIIYTYDVRFHEDIQKGPLALVNRTHATKDLEEGLVSVFEHKNSHYLVKDQEVLLTEECIKALNAMLKAFYEATGREDLQVISGYRTKAYQQSLYDNAAQDDAEDAASRVAKAGHSEHETGQAVDFNIFRDGITLEFDGTEEYAWLAEHCTEYGFVLRYPEHKVAVTEFSYEPWHFRYVGVPHAQYMQEENLVLDEYIPMLSAYTYSGTHLEINDKNGFLYEVFFVPKNEESNTTEIPIPAELEYTVSGNNIDGYIVTVATGKKQQASAQQIPADPKPESSAADESADLPTA